MHHHKRVVDARVQRKDAVHAEGVVQLVQQFAFGVFDEYGPFKRRPYKRAIRFGGAKGVNGFVVGEEDFFAFEAFGVDCVHG